MHSFPRQWIWISLTKLISQAAGLTIAARLSEDTSSRVVVLEAGPANINDPLISLSILIYPRSYCSSLRLLCASYCHATCSDPGTVWQSTWQSQVRLVFSYCSPETRQGLRQLLVEGTHARRLNCHQLLCTFSRPYFRFMELRDPH